MAAMHPSPIFQAADFPHRGLPWWLRQYRICLQCKRPGFDPWVGKISWRRKQQPTPVFLPGKSRGQRSLAGYSPQGHKDSDTNERQTLSFPTWSHEGSTDAHHCHINKRNPDSSLILFLPSTLCSFFLVSHQIIFFCVLVKRVVFNQHWLNCFFMPQETVCLQSYYRGKHSSGRIQELL